MNLFRLASHAKNNKLHIDKLIAIEGVPEHLLFESRGGKQVLRQFLGFGIPENLPKDIRKEFCNGDTILRYVAPFEKGAEAVFQEIPLYDIVIDCGTRQGAELWEKIERMIDDQTPRDRKVPEPVVVAKDHKSGFAVSSEDIPVATLVWPEATTEIERKRPGRPRKEVVGV